MLEVGRIYQNSKGPFTVMGKMGDRVRIRYFGSREPVVCYGPVLENVSQTFDNPLAELVAKLLECHHFVELKCPSKYLAKMQDQYLEATGVELKEDDPGVSINENAWAIGLQISMPAVLSPLLPPGIKKRMAAGKRGKAIVISNNELVWELIRLGIRSGSKSSLKEGACR